MTHLAVDAKPPRYGRSLTPQLAVDEVTEAAEEQAQRRQRHGEIVDVGGMTAAAPGKQRERGGDTEHPAVKGHAAFPEPEWIPRVVCPERQAVEQHVADAPAENHTEHGEENHIVDIALLPGRAGLCGAPARQPPGRREPEQVHDAVPMRSEERRVGKECRSRWSP